MNKHQLSSHLLKLEIDLEKHGYDVQGVLTYLADVNEKEIQRFQHAEDLEMLMIFGGDDLVGLRKTFARYFEQLKPKGIATILITGGIGRLTATLIEALAQEQQSGEVSSLSIQTQPVSASRFPRMSNILNIRSAVLQNKFPGVQKVCFCTI